MKKILALIFIVLIFSCKKDKVEKNILTHNTSVNLVCNSSFEINNLQSINCWNIVKDFSTYPDTFSTDVPHDGGYFSLRLNGIRDVNWEPYAETFVTNLSGEKIISLSAYIKAVYGGQVTNLILEQIRAGMVIRNKIFSDYAINGWEKFIINDTLTMLTTDSLRIKIVQTTSQNSGSLIDLVELKTN
jgi:hypothetical protein